MFLEEFNKIKVGKGGTKMSSPTVISSNTSVKIGLRVKTIISPIEILTSYLLTLVLDYQTQKDI